MPNRPLRKYEPIWKELKAAPDHIVECSVLPMHVQRVMKGIMKEKMKDRGTLLLNLDEGDNVRLRFKYDKKEQVLSIELKQTLGIDEMVV